ncbi:MAG: (d)CMP kinase [Actinomycetota bacterium]
MSGAAVERDGEGIGVIIAIDGPAGAGKSTVGRAVASRLGLGYLDTGAMYRGVTHAVLRRGVEPSDLDAVADVVAEVELHVGPPLDGRHGEPTAGDIAPDIVVVDGEDATAAIRGREVTGAVSAVAANSAVRAEMVRRQRAWVADRRGGVIEGRDIGSVVFPDADLKLYVTASARVRAERRVAEIGGDVDEVEASIIERDRKDSSRADSPLTEAAGSTVVDTTGMTIVEVVDHVLAMLPASRRAEAE